jgi:hypothetical protein
MNTRLVDASGMGTDPLGFHLCASVLIRGFGASVALLGGEVDHLGLELECGSAAVSE